jgi:hypothetical protein
VPAEPPLHSTPRMRRVEIEGREVTQDGQPQAAEVTHQQLSQPPPPPPQQPPQQPSPPRTYAAATAAQGYLRQPPLPTRPWRGQCRGCKASTLVYETNHGYYCDPCFRRLISYMKRHETTCFELYLIEDD